MPPRPITTGRCNCGADAHHEHMLARDNNNRNNSMLGENSMALNGFIRRPDVRAWNFTLLPPTSNGVHNLFSTSKQHQQNNPNRLQLLQESMESMNNNSNSTEGGNQNQQQQPVTNSRITTTSTSAQEFPDDPNFISVRSDADQELLVFCPFSEFLNIRAMMISCNPNSCPPAEEPSSVQLFINRQEAHLGFTDVRRAAPAQSIKLGSSSSPGDAIIYMLDAGRFRSVSSVTLFFKTSYGGQFTQASRIIFFGESTREPVHREIATNVVTETMADPAEHVRRLQAEANNNVLRS
jgi:hypothetical protein